MELKILGSNSKGNCYIFTDSNGYSLIVEAGVHITEIDKSLNFDYSKVVGGVVSHLHFDHCKCVKELINKGVNMYMSGGTANALNINSRFVINKDIWHHCGQFNIKAFEIDHDAAEPFGYIIHHPEMGNTLFLTDTYILRYNFIGLNNIIIEANYCEEIISNRPIQHKDRVIENHMSIQTTLKTLSKLDLTAVNNIVLIHLSDGNSNALEFKTKAENQTLKTVHIAQKGLEIPFNSTPF